MSLPSLTGKPGGSFICTNSLSLLKCLKGAITSKTFNNLHRTREEDKPTWKGKQLSNRSKAEKHKDDRLIFQKENLILSHLEISLHFFKIILLNCLSGIKTTTGLTVETWSSPQRRTGQRQRTNFILFIYMVHSILF